MPTISGVWKWNDSPVISGRAAIEQNIDFVSDKTNCTVIHINDARVGRGNLGYDGNGFANKVVYGAELGNVWLKEEFKTMNFGDTEQEVSQDFYNYLTANATKQEEPVVPTTTKTVSSDNLARFKQKCDETYAGKDEIPNVPAIPAPTTADNGKVLGVANGAYALQAASGGGTQLYSHNLNIDNNNYFFISTSETPCNSLRALQASNIIMGSRTLENPSPSITKFVVAVFSSIMLYINITGTFQGPTGADFAVINLSSATISDTVIPL